MSTESEKKLSQERTAVAIKKLLGSLELEVMEIMWQAGEATVQQVTKVLDQRQPIAYTTVMTVMTHLVNKGLLARTKESKRYRYQVAQSRDQFLQEVSRKMICSFVEDFGDLAIARFLDELDKVDVKRLDQLRHLGREAEGDGRAAG